ncbi:MAG: VWA domain-containing protein [Gammaproteobacteria bacterium]|jgi:Ca-activated chloride channel family protein|nr:VWA domain-containing protein [Gammaproteobacteria bacterium]MDH3846667.1 VWA domain-containing protein [Gammaproteobacteria bacterium]MDH3864362.1 VWA domain-containing protein [Gammaproteobacteria bacterium]MDH3906046.1 VWA domain-containing protein [Gammaproteobacteria bacterium]MDH4004749.1 VWA domain-containing protein [Gammaproteobacteria bacterium]
MPAEFQFLRPEWLWAIPAVIATAVLLARRQLGPGNWQRVVDPALAPHILSGSPRRKSDLRWWLVGITGVIGVLSLAGPAWQRIEQPVYRSDQALVVALDLSRSMDAQDVAPSRMLRARLKILDILERRASGQTALVVYSSNAFTVTPLTNDNDTIAALVNSLSTDIMPSRGSYPAAAIYKGRQLLDQAGAAFGEVLLITDGGSSPATERAARDLRDAGYTLSVLGAGTKEGAPIPKLSGGFVTDQAGRIAVARLEERGLRELAMSGSGRYATLSSDGRDLDYLMAGEVGTRKSSDDSLATDQWREEGPWLALLLLPLGALAFRRGWVVMLAIAVLPLSQPAEASLWDDLWFNKDQQAQRQLEAGKAADAAGLFEDPEWRAVAEYEAGAYAQSAARFAEQDDLRNLYNLGNALARQGEFDSAIDAYEQVLEADPDNEDAAFNRDLLKQMQDQESQQQNQGDDQQSSDQSGGDSQESESDASSQNESSEGSSDSQSQSGEQNASQRDDEMSEEDMQALQEELQRAAEEAEKEAGQQSPQLSEEQLEALRREQEQQQAMEQWLRRIPNDPGGLLRRKFRYQYQRMGRDQDGNNLWPDDEVQPW